MRVSNTRDKTITTDTARTDQTTTDRTQSKPGITNTRTVTNNTTRTHINRPTTHLANNRGSMDYLLCGAFVPLAPDLCEPLGLQPSLIHKLAPADKLMLIMLTCAYW
jgi:hypothetical protein